MISNETQYDNEQLAQLQNELKDNQLYSGIGIIPGTDIGGGSEGGENGTVNPPTNTGNTNQGGSNTNTGGDNTNTGGDNQNQNANVKPSENQNPGGGTIVDGKTDEDPKFYVVSGEEIAASFYQSDVTIQIFTNERAKKIKYILTTTVKEISDELYPSGLVRELDIENGGTLTFTKDGEYTITAYAYDTAGNKSNPTIMWFKRQTGGSTTGGITVSIASGNEGANKWYTSNVTLRVLGTDTGSAEVRYRVRGTATSIGQIGDKDVLSPGNFDSGEVKIANGTTFRIVADGTYSITAYSYDAGGMRLSSSEVLNIKKDATRPTVQSYTGEQIPGQGFKVKVNAVDTGAGLTSNAYTYRHKESSSLAEYTSEVSGNTEKLYTGLDQTKTYDMYVMVTDQAGNIAITDVIARPSLWISNNITVGETVSNGVEGARKYSRSETVALTFRGQDSNNVDIMKTTYQVLGTVDKEGSIAGNTVTGGQELKDEYSLNDKETRTIQLQADGNWTVKVHNYNKEGKLVTTNTVEVTRDITPPDLTAFTRTARGTGTLNVKVDVTEPCSGYASNNTGFQYFEGTASKSIQGSNTYQYTGLTDIKTYAFKVIVKDKAGNTSGKTLSTVAGATQNFAYTGSAQQITLDAGKYKLEVWGAQGSNGKGSSGGKGGYACGALEVDGSEELKVFVGGSTGWNGGGTGGYGVSGGGGTDVRAGGSTLNNRVIVAGGGGGGGDNWSGGVGTSGSGGGNAGTSGTSYSYNYNGTNCYANGGGGGSISGGGAGGGAAGTQGISNLTGSKGEFGVGGGGAGWDESHRSGCGGGGWFGGGGGGCNAYGWGICGVGGGGSGYVLTASSHKPSGYLLGSKYYLSNAQTIAGNKSFPAPGGGTETGHSGNGFARITLVE